MDTQEKKDHEFELFVLEQVKRFGDLNAKSTYVYSLLTAACIAMAVLGIIMGKPVLQALCIGAMSVGFIAARMYYLGEAESIREAADRIQEAIDDPDFDIPDDYPEDILALRSLVCPTFRNVISQLIAYGIIALTLWLATLLIFFLSGPGYEVFYFVSFITAAMASVVTILAVRAFRDLSVARAYENYLNEAAGRSSAK